MCFASSLTLFRVLSQYAVPGFPLIVSLSVQCSLTKTPFVFFPAVFWPLLFYYTLQSFALFCCFIFCLASLYWLSWTLKMLESSLRNIFRTLNFLNGVVSFFPALRQFLSPVVAESNMGQPWFSFFFFFLNVTCKLIRYYCRAIHAWV